MKDILVLLVLLISHTTEVWSLPYEATGMCNNPEREYKLPRNNLCCKRCPPGQRMKAFCSENTETLCEPCPSRQYMENWNYAPNCVSCKTCKPNRGLQYAQTCSSTTEAMCVCQPGMYCFMDFRDPYCSDCRKYLVCKVGSGVSVAGTANSNVKCKPCPEGTFSDTASSTDPCRPHTNCNGRAVVQNGNATSDTVCEPEASTQPQSPMTTPRTEAVYITTHPPMRPDMKTIVAITIPCVTGILLLLAIILLVQCYRTWKKDTARFPHKLDANGNCENSNEIKQHYFGQSELTSYTVSSPEQHCLLEKGEASNDYSQCSSSNTETLYRRDGCGSQGSISPLQSTTTLDNPHSALSEPLTLMSHAEPVTPQSSIPTQSSSQPTSPQIISPVSASPHVNVNITFHIGNGSCGTPAIMPDTMTDMTNMTDVPTDSMQTDSNLPLGEEEECCSFPKQEANKNVLMSV